MIDTQLPQVRRGVPSDIGERLEAFAYTMLASYASGAIDATTLLAFKRAWGYDSLFSFPAVGTTVPAYVMAMYTTEGTTTIVIAIDGITNLTWLAGMMRSPGSNAIAGLPGRVFNTFDTVSETIKTAILADTVFQAAINHRRFNITFAGFSLGAALAEVLAAKFKLLYSYANVACYKFAAPRVGNYNWEEGKDPTIRWSCIYTAADPVSGFPFATQATNWAPFVPVVNQTLYVRDFDSTFYSLSPVRPTGLPVDNAVGSMLMLTQYPGSPWDVHTVLAYRQLLWAMALTTGGLNEYRFNYLTTPNENNFQLLAAQLVYFNASELAVLDPAPPTVSIPLALGGGAGTDIGGGGGGDDDGIEGGGGVDWVPLAGVIAPPAPVIIAPAVPNVLQPNWGTQLQPTRNRTRAR